MLQHSPGPCTVVVVLVVLVSSSSPPLLLWFSSALASVEAALVGLAAALEPDSDQEPDQEPGLSGLLSVEWWFRRLVVGAVVAAGDRSRFWSGVVGLSGRFPEAVGGAKGGDGE